jgi:hypothetical protein
MQAEIGRIESNQPGTLLQSRHNTETTVCNNGSTLLPNHIEGGYGAAPTSKIARQLVRFGAGLLEGQLKGANLGLQAAICPGSGTAGIHRCAGCIT